MKTLSIGQLAKKSQVNVETVRYYERRGLIPKAPRRASGYRLFSEKDIDRIRFIKQAKALGFTLDEISELLALKVGPRATCGDVAQRVASKLADVEEKITTLSRMKETLVKLKNACKKLNAPSKDCPILESLDAEDNQGNGK